MMNKIPRLTPAPNSPPPVHTVELDEFAQIPQAPEIDARTPVVWFIILIVLIGAMVYLTKFIRNKD